MNERELQKAAIDLAHRLGWRVAHFHAAPAGSSGGYRTPVAADGAGFPDLVLTHPDLGVMFRELKADIGRLRPTQIVWLAELRLAGANAGVWKPTDWRNGRIEGELRGQTTLAVDELEHDPETAQIPF